MSKIDTALQIATAAHAGQTDRDGEAYILHPITVGMMGQTDDERMAGFLHDVVEDTPWTFEQLIDAGIPTSVVNALRLLTHDKTTDYYDYVQRVIDSGNPVALKVKYHDLLHNYARGKAYPDLQRKHGKALQMVREAVEARSEVGLYTPPADPDTEVAIFAGGCFWGVQHEFEKIEGVRRTLVGYAGSDVEPPTYQSVRSRLTRYVEAVIVEYSPAVVTYDTLCKVFFEMHDPAQTDGVGPDLGPQYRSCIFYRSDFQRQEAQRVIDILRSRDNEVNTLLLPEQPFWIGEEFHQRYYERTGGEPYCHIRTKKF